MFGERLRELREHHNYSMDKLIDIYNNRFDGKMNKSTLSRYENGLQDPIYTVVVNLSKIFNVSVDYLSGVSDENTSIKEVNAKKNVTILSERLKQTREHLKISRKDVAEHLGIAVRTYASYENGEREPNSETLISLSKLYNVSTDYMLGLSDTPISHSDGTKFSRRLKELRNARNMTQQDLADMIGISKSSINMYEHGEREPGIETLKALGDIFDVDLDYIVGKTNTPQKSLDTSSGNDSYTEATKMFTDKLKKLMEYHGLNNSTFSKQSGIPYTTIDGLFKKGYKNIKLSTLKQIANFFNVSLDYLVFDDPKELSIEQKKLIEDYESLDEHGKQLVDMIISTEKERCELHRKNEKEKMESENSEDDYAWVAAKGIGPHRVKSTVSDEELIEFAKKHRKLPNFD